MKLEDIGFYTLSDERAKGLTIANPLSRCELILTDQCNLHCVYCRGLEDSLKGTLPFEDAKRVMMLWLNDGLQNIRFSGGEPTLYPRLHNLVTMARDGGVKRIAVSTNGTRSISYYESLVKAGVNDFSVSLDSGCCAIGDSMAGGIKGAWDKAVNTIREIGQMTYVTVGMVFTEKNISDAMESVLFVDSLGVSDIRIIPSAQYNQALTMLDDLPDNILSKYPILRYRINNLREGRHIRGLTISDSPRCYLVMDDMAVAKGYHFPCIIYMREGGKPIGKVGPDMRLERSIWTYTNVRQFDPICQENCLDVCVDFNNKVRQFRRERLFSLLEEEDESVVSIGEV